MVSYSSNSSLLVFYCFYFYFFRLCTLTPFYSGNRERQVINQWAKSLAITSMGKAAYWGALSLKGRPGVLCRITRGTRALAVKRGLMCATDDELRVSWLLVQCIPATQVPVPVPYFYRLGRQCLSKSKWF